MPTPPANPTDPELAAVVAAWPDLPPAIRAGGEGGDAPDAPHGPEWAGWRHGWPDALSDAATVDLLEGLERVDLSGLLAKLNAPHLPTPRHSERSPPKPPAGVS
jgi:hypothetical protein